MSYDGFAIDKYLDADAVNAQLDRLKSSPVYGVLPDALERYEKSILKRSARAQKLR